MNDTTERGEAVQVDFESLRINRSPMPSIKGRLPMLELGKEYYFIDKPFLCTCMKICKGILVSRKESFIEDKKGKKAYYKYEFDSNNMADGTVSDRRLIFSLDKKKEAMDFVAWYNWVVNLERMNRHNPE